MIEVFFVTCPSCGLYYGCGEDTQMGGHEKWVEECPQKENHPERSEGEMVLLVDPEYDLERADSLLKFLVFKNRRLALNIVEDYREYVDADPDAAEDPENLEVLFRELKSGIQDQVPDDIVVAEREENGKVLYGLFREESA